MKRLLLSLLTLGLFLLLVSGPVSIGPITQASADGDCVPAYSGLVSWWSGDGDAKDILDGNDGSMQGGVTFTSGMVGQAFSFDGHDDIVLVPHNPNLNFGDGQNFTIDAWINLQNPIPGVDDSIVMKWNVQNKRIGVTTNYYWLNVNRDTHRIRFGLSSGAEGRDLDSVSAVALGVWTHVAVVRDGDQGHIYINGQLDNSGRVPSGTLANGDPLAIGAVYDTLFNPPVVLGHGFGGLIDEVEIFNRALTASEIQAIYDAGSAGNCKYTAVTIDIKPGSNPNSINLGSGGTVPVAILSTPGFDATTVNPTTVTLAGAQVQLKGKGTPMASSEDVNGDGLLDLVVHVSTEALQLSETDTEAILEGQTFSGTPVRGIDSARIVP
jgi:hypothetical protein